MLWREKQGFVVKNHCSPCSWTDCCWSERCTPSLSAECPPLSAPAYSIQSVHPGRNRRVTVFNHQVSVLTSKKKQGQARDQDKTLISRGKALYMIVSYSITGIFPLKMSLWEGDYTRPCPRDYVCPDIVRSKSLWPLTQEKSKTFSAFLFFSGHLIIKTHLKLKWIKPHLKTTGLKKKSQFCWFPFGGWPKSLWSMWKKKLYAGKTQCSFLGCFNKGGKKSCNVSQIWFKQVFRGFFSSAILLKHESKSWF